jgi:ribonuclease HII
MILNLESFNPQNLNICGIDEAGRGALAGPLTVAGVLLKSEIKDLSDSKKLTEKKREELYSKIIENSIYKIVFKSNQEIDKKGLTICIKESILEIIENVKTNNYIMDGNHNFGINKIHTIIKADDLVPSVSAASILAKVSRDRYMTNLEDYKEYEFNKHKGYGTKKHIELIEKYGLSNIHRTSFKLKKNTKIVNNSLF